ncbi:hypothetical protein L3Y34_006966 [Caenorhabditis briggsae]|uniref:Uncharacterized protein n=1 Tax=Caenorhabditis briggsae TaxID=6238 RepID=A0AAE8ZY06_CAEBR|nr:hypothetical protein L3Y34_006966 [Caenorhabditis briggsae]
MTSWVLVTILLPNEHRKLLAILGCLSAELNAAGGDSSLASSAPHDTFNLPHLGENVFTAPPTNLNEYEKLKPLQFPVLNNGWKNGQVNHTRLYKNLMKSRVGH